MSSPHSFPRVTFTQFLYFLPCSSTEEQGMGVVVSSSHVASAAPSSGGRLFTLPPAPTRGLSHRLQSFRNRLLQYGSPVDPQVLSGACSSAGFPWGLSLLWGAPAPAWSPPWATRSQPPSPWSSPQAVGEPLLQCLGHLLLPLSSLSWCPAHQP